MRRRGQVSIYCELLFHYPAWCGRKNFHSIFRLSPMRDMMTKTCCIGRESGQTLMGKLKKKKCLIDNGGKKTMVVTIIFHLLQFFFEIIALQ